MQQMGEDKVKIFVECSSEEVISDLADKISEMLQKLMLSKLESKKQ